MTQLSWFTPNYIAQQTNENYGLMRLLLTVQSLKIKSFKSALLQHIYLYRLFGENCAKVCIVMILTLFFTKLIALKLLVPTNFKTVPPGLATYGIWPGGCNLKINKMTPIESVQHSKPLWDDQRPGFYGKLFYEEPERTEKIPIIVGSSLSTVTVVLHSKGIWAKLFHQDVLSVVTFKNQLNEILFYQSFQVEHICFLVGKCSSPSFMYPKLSKLPI